MAPDNPNERFDNIIIIFTLERRTPQWHMLRRSTYQHHGPPKIPKTRKPRLVSTSTRPQGTHPEFPTEKKERTGLSQQLLRAPHRRKQPPKPPATTPTPTPAAPATTTLLLERLEPELCPFIVPKLDRPSRSLTPPPTLFPDHSFLGLLEQLAALGLLRLRQRRLNTLLVLVLLHRPGGVFALAFMAFIARRRRRRAGPTPFAVPGWAPAYPPLSPPAVQLFASVRLVQTCFSNEYHRVLLSITVLLV